MAKLAIYLFLINLGILKKVGTEQIREKRHFSAKVWYQEMGLVDDTESFSFSEGQTTAAVVRRYLRVW